MADLSVEICGLKFENPVLPAAGPTVWDGQAMLRCVEGGAGGIVTKTISTTAAQVPQPCMAEYGKGSMLNTELWSEYPPEQYIEHEYAIAKQAGVPLIVSLGYTAGQIAELAPRVRPFADALELSTHYIGDDPQPMVDAIRAAKNAADVPVLVKFSPFRDVQRAAEEAQKAGADGIVAVNSYGPSFGIDIETGMPLMGSREGYGWLSGQAIKAIALRCVYDIARTVDLPIFGVGGISRGEDALCLGPPGSGRNHLAQAIGLAVIHQARRVAYREVHTLLEEFADSTLDGERKHCVAGVHRRGFQEDAPGLYRSRIWALCFAMVVS